MKHHMSTYVTVPERLGKQALLRLATDRLGGDLALDAKGNGIKCISQNLSNGQLCGTFTRDWETPDEGVTHTDGE